MNKNAIYTIIVIVIVACIASAALLHHHGGATKSATNTQTQATATTSSVSTSTSQATTSGGKQLVIFCAGSLYIPLEKLASIYEEQHPGVKVYIEPSGSVKAVRKVIDLHRRCDVLAVADYRLIPKYMIPNYTKWAIAFATNRIVLCYTNKSRYAGLINESNWISILEKPGVRYGFSNPNDDPCGYRAVTVLALASLLYNDSSILEKLVLNETNIKAEYKNGSITLYVPPNLEVKGRKLDVRSKSVDLIALLEAGVIDYAFEYKSVAVQHNLSYVELPPQLNLGYPEYSSFYGRVKVYILYGSSEEKCIVGAPIVYGVTIPDTVANYNGAIGFIKLLLSSTGEKVFESYGQPFLKKPMYIGSVPGELKVGQAS